MAKELAQLFVTLGMDDKGLQKTLNNVQKNLTQAGKVMTGLGVGITAALGLSTKAALDEQIGINQLSQALQNIGEDYGNLSGKIEGAIGQMQAMTSFGDGEQREALSELISITGQYEGSLQQMQLAADMAAAKNMDLVSAARLVGRAAIGDTALLKRYGIVVEEGASATETLAQMQERFGGSAQAMADPLKQIQNYLGDMAEQIGGFVLPVLKKMVDAIIPIIQKVMAWIDAHPELTKMLVMVVGAVGALMAVLGPLLLLLPALAAGFTLLLGPVGLVIAAVVAVAAGAALLIMNWDKVVDFFKGLWEGIKKAFSAAVEWIKEYGLYFLGMPGLIIKHWKDIVGFFKMVVEKIGGAFGKVKDIILAPFRAAWKGIESGINWVIKMLNKIKVDIPDWIPGIGGRSFGIDIAPVNLPEFHAGGVVPGYAGQEVPIMAQAGETIIPAGQGGGVTININNPVVRQDSDIQAIARAVSREIYKEKQKG